MIFPYILLFHLFVLIKSLNICSNCKYFIPGEATSPQIFYSKCAAFPHLTYLISEENIATNEKYENNYYCSTARSHESMCGKEGKKFKSNNKYHGKKLDIMD